jgi:hypothetical protein
MLNVYPARRFYESAIARLLAQIIRIGVVFHIWRDRVLELSHRRADLVEPVLDAVGRRCEDSIYPVALLEGGPPSLDHRITLGEQP